VSAPRLLNILSERHPLSHNIGKCSARVVNERALYFSIVVLFSSQILCIICCAGGGFARRQMLRAESMI
jgi:hypothetical protein